MAVSRRLFDGKPSCLWVIGITALMIMTVNPALGLILGWISECIRAAIVFGDFISERLPCCRYHFMEGSGADAECCGGGE